MPLNFQFIVDGHALEWGASPLFFFCFFQKNHTCEYRLHSILRRWRRRLRLRLRYGTRILFHIVRSFQIHSISKWNDAFVRKSKRANEWTTWNSNGFDASFVLLNSKFRILFSSPHFYHHNSIGIKVWYSTGGTCDGAKMQLMHQHQHTQCIIALYESHLYFQSFHKWNERRKNEIANQRMHRNIFHRSIENRWGENAVAALHFHFR